MLMISSILGGALTNPTTSAASISGSIPDTTTPTRGIKRSHSGGDSNGDLQEGDILGDHGNPKPPKRGRPTRPMRIGMSESPTQLSMPLSSQTASAGPLPPRTPQAQTAQLPSQFTNTTSTQSSPPKTTPKSVIKALPTVRDHTTDQVTPEGDEYVPRESDKQGERKVQATGHLNGNREYKCRTFLVTHRGSKLFMLATECARVLGYRDSYLLFNKNRSLYKIIATQAEKEDLIAQEILPFSYRSRQIAIVTAKSMFRQFGSRVIAGGRRVRDDYWEAKALKQGFTEEDMAGEKRPGAAKARDTEGAAASASANLTLGHPGDIVYANPPHYGSSPHLQQGHSGIMGAPGNGQMLPMITLAPEQPDVRLKDYSSIRGPRQEITGLPYQDNTRSSAQAELLQQSHNAVDYNKMINTGREKNSEYIRNYWMKPHDASPVSQQPVGTSDGLPSTQALQSPRTTPSGMHQPALTQHNPQHMMSAQPYSQPRQQNPIAQSPMRGPQTPMGVSGMPYAAGQMGQGGVSYGYPQQTQMYPPSQPQQSSQSQYPTYTGHSQLSPHIPQSPHALPQLRHSGSNPQMQQNMQYQPMQGIPQGYPAQQNRNMYSDQSSQQFMQQATSAGPQPGTQGWSPAQPPQGGNWWGAQQQ
ncbi:chromatin remodelling complex Rsc7/Swp82 subunit-domain-containing protein [Calycina marina]|uniref:Chromatin remodelling complex Rsc7/Swp82 subunit-domain-containing protein n=1 Tax=Calycina marina TaxID=1763456 RepID=A0A9P8CBT1_9HELO|nr:chromatin remodelling complex Rsc7/Swp82 subunit-domain-containing protein [Calycina marina]